MLEAFDAWELRWTARYLPTLDAAWLPSSSLDPASRVVDEHDVYVLTLSDRINLKVRHRENSLKLKRLLERTDDGFERWRTEFDAPLPAGFRNASDVVLDLIGIEAPQTNLVLRREPVRWSRSWTRSVNRRSWLRSTRLATCSSAELAPSMRLASRPGGAPTVPWGREQQPRRPPRARAGLGTGQAWLAVQLHRVPRGPSVMGRPPPRQRMPPSSPVYWALWSQSWGAHSVPDRRARQAA